jgi:hypothetical protein
MSSRCAFSASEISSALVLAADFNGNLESAGDGLCLLQQLQGPIAPPSGANPDFAVFIIADQVLQHAPRLNVGGEGFDFPWASPSAR